ncbi:MAG: AbrB/MazE/SpoVT family DNA-binding domain-containing protein [Nitrososphaeraceae archaeon]
MTRIRLDSNRPMKLRRLIEFNNSTSLGIVIPKSMVQMMNLRLGDYMACEMNEDGTGLSLNKCSLTAEPVEDSIVERIEDDND